MQLIVEPLHTEGHLLHIALGLEYLLNFRLVLGTKERPHTNKHLYEGHTIAKHIHLVRLLVVVDRQCCAQIKSDVNGWLLVKVSSTEVEDAPLEYI